MLILTRSLNESILIGDDIIITLLEVAEHTVRLGITAPQTVIVHRKEMYERIARGEPFAEKPDVAPLKDRVVATSGQSWRRGQFLDGGTAKLSLAPCRTYLTAQCAIGGVAENRGRVSIIPQRDV